MGTGACREGGVRRSLRHDKAEQESEGEKGGWEELLKKRRGRTHFGPGWRFKLADEANSDAIPDTTGGEGGHGTAKPEGVIHRYFLGETR